MKVFIMPSVFIAFVDKADPKHLEASAFFRYFAQNQFSLFTSDIVVSQAYDLMYETITPRLAKKFLSSMILGNINLLYPQERDIRKAVKALETSRNPELPFSDALAAILAEKRGISQICTIDSFQPMFGLKVFSLPV